MSHRPSFIAYSMYPYLFACLAKVYVHVSNQFKILNLIIPLSFCNLSFSEVILMSIIELCSYM